MKNTFTYSRKVRIPLEDDKYNAIEYFHGSSIEFNEDDMQEVTVIAINEFKELQKMIDEIQRKTIKEELGITILPHDKQKEKIENKPYSFKKRLIKK